MKFTYTPALVEYMNKTGKKDIVFELITCNADVDVTELHTHFANERDFLYFTQREGYSVKQTEHGRLLFPHYKLEFEDEVLLDIKKTFCFFSVTCKGIKV